MVIETPTAVIWLLEKFVKENLEIYIVGGAVRDLLMGRQVRDWDFTTNAQPEKIVSLFEETFYENDFGTVGVVNPEEKQRYEDGDIAMLPIYEVTTFRTEHGYSDGRRPDEVKWGESLEEDLARRDFTISAMALKPNFQGGIVDYELIDLHGGKVDLDNKIIRTVGNPVDRFSEDGLRMVRAIRIGAQLGFGLDEETLQAIGDCKNLIVRISNERIRDEFLKILTSNYPAEGITLLYTCGLLVYIMPELIESRDVWQGGHHRDDVWTHALKSLESNPSRDPIVKLATLIHDIGKPRSRAFICSSCKFFFKHEDEIENVNLMKEWTCPRCSSVNGYRDTVAFHNHEMIGAKMAVEICDRLRLSNKDTERVITLIRWHMFSVDERQTEKAVRRFIRNVGKENLEDMLNLRIGDRLGGGARETSWRLEKFKQMLLEVQQQPFGIHDLKITGNEVMELLGIEPGRKVGEVLRKLFEEVDEEKLANEPEELKKRAMEIKNED